MITVGMNYEIREGKDQAFEKMFGKVLNIMGKTEGHVKTHLYRDVFETRSYLIVSEWSTRTAFDSFIESEQFSKVTDWGNADILASRPRHDIYEGDAGLPLASGCSYHAPQTVHA